MSNQPGSSAPSISQPIEAVGGASSSQGASYWKFWTWQWRGHGEGPSVSSVPSIVHPQQQDSPQSIPNQSIVHPTSPSVTSSSELAIPSVSNEQSGWERIKKIYTDDVSMEKDVIERILRMTFFGGFLMGGAGGYAQAKKQYEMSNVGRKYLSPSDAVKRRTDYAIVRFAKGGFSMGIKCALISGTIVVLTTHLSTYRDRFSSLYLPALSGVMAVTLHTALVGGVFTFPLGAIGAAKATGLGVTSGLTLAAVVQLYALSIDRNSNDAYWHFKKEYERELKTTTEWDARVAEFMEHEKIMWRQTAVKRLKQIDEEALRNQDV